MNTIQTKKRKIKNIYYKSLHCPLCGRELIKDSIEYLTNPPQYIYFCSNCNFREISFEKPGYELEFEEDIEERNNLIDLFTGETDV